MKNINVTNTKRPHHKKQSIKKPPKPTNFSNLRSEPYKKYESKRNIKIAHFSYEFTKLGLNDPFLANKIRDPVKSIINPTIFPQTTKSINTKTVLEKCNLGPVRNQYVGKLEPKLLPIGNESLTNLSTTSISCVTDENQIPLKYYKSESPKFISINHLSKPLSNLMNIYCEDTKNSKKSVQNEVIDNEIIVNIK